MKEQRMVLSLRPKGQTPSEITRYKLLAALALQWFKLSRTMSLICQASFEISNGTSVFSVGGGCEAFESGDEVLMST